MGYAESAGIRIGMFAAVLVRSRELTEATAVTIGLGKLLQMLEGFVEAIEKPAAVNGVGEVVNKLGKLGETMEKPAAVVWRELETLVDKLVSLGKMAAGSMWQYFEYITSLILSAEWMYAYVHQYVGYSRG
jgi:hypothetical protein